LEYKKSFNIPIIYCFFSIL